MNHNLNLALREYLRLRGTSKLFGYLFAVGALIVVGQLSPQISQHFAPLAVLAPIIRDPFTVLATIIFLCSQTIFDFMRFRLRTSGEAPVASDPLVQQVEIPKQYRSSFGDDLLAKSWRWRLLFVLSFGIAAMRWILTWTTI